MVTSVRLNYALYTIVFYTLEDLKRNKSCGMKNIPVIGFRP